MADVFDIAMDGCIDIVSQSLLPRACIESPKRWPVCVAKPTRMKEEMRDSVSVIDYLLLLSLRCDTDWRLSCD